jgi:hypothetical protein
VYTRHALARQQALGAEALHLLAGPLGQLGAADTAWKAQLILDPRAAAGLAAQRIALDQHCFWPFRCAAHSRAQASRAGAIDRQVILGAGGSAEPAEFLGDPPNRRAFQTGAIREDADG